MEQYAVIKISIEELKTLITQAVQQAIAEIPQVKAYAGEPKFINLDSLCEKYQWRKPTIYGLVSKRLIPHTKMGKKLYFNIEEIDNWIASGKRKTITEIEKEADEYLSRKKR